MKRYIRAGLRKLGYDIRKVAESGAPGAIDFLHSRRIDLVLDVGANIGQFAMSLRRQGYLGEIISFEPVGNVFRKLVENIAGDRKWSALNFALGPNKGKAPINVSDHTVFSSLLEQTDLSHLLDQRSRVVRTEEIDVVRLDDVFEPFRGRNVFLKIDTQGFEKEVLEGASSALKTILGVMIEVPIVPLYRQTWTIAPAVDYMARAGFAPCQISPVNFHPHDYVSLIEVDCIFRRSDDLRRTAPRPVKA